MVIQEFSKAPTEQKKKRGSRGGGRARYGMGCCGYFTIIFWVSPFLRTTTLTSPCTRLK